MEDITITPITDQVLDWKPKSAKTLRSYLKRLVRINYLAYLLSVAMAMGTLFALGVYLAGRWTFYNPPYGHAVTLFHCLHALIVLLVLRIWAWPRIRRPQTMTQLAYRIEKGDRRIHTKQKDEDPLEYVLESRDERLTSAVTSALEFSDPDPILEQCLIPSRNLLAGSGRASETKGLYERVLIDLQGRKLWKWVIPISFWVTLGLAIVVGGCAFFLDRIEPFTASDAWKFYRGNFLANPYRPLHQLLVNPGTVDTVLKGESLKVWGTLIGPGTHQAEITYNMVGFPEQKADMKNNGPPNSFVYEFENLQSDLSYRVKSGPLESPQYYVKVRIPPELTSIRLTYYYPEFMKKSFELMPAGQGAAIAPLGTTVEVTTKWNQSMQQVDIVINGKDVFPMTRGGNYHKGSFPLTSAGAYVLSGTSAEGVRTRGDLEFPIQALVDLPPEIEWTFPEKDLDFSSAKKRIRRIPLRFRTTDDFGLHSIELYAGAPDRATSTYEVARIDGKEKEYEGEYLLDLRPFENSPVCRVYFMATDNHPGIQGRTITEVRRLYFQPPGSFLEEDDPNKREYVEGDPFEMTANELFALLKMQETQNANLNDQKTVTDQEKTTWLEEQERIVQLTTRTVILTKERADKLLSGPSIPGEEKGIAEVEVVEGSKETGVQDLPIRLLQVIKRLSGGIERLNELQPGKKPTGNSALDRQLKQWEAGEENRGQRAREEGERAYTEIELAFKELTGKDLPAPVEEAMEELEREKGDGQGPGDGIGEEEDGEGEPEEGEDKEGEEGEGAEEGDEVAKKKKKDDNAQTESWAADREGQDKKGRFAPGVAGKEGQGEEAKEDAVIGDGPTTPSNTYAASEYTLDPETVLIETPASSMMRKQVSRELSGLDMNQYRDLEIPKEYRDSASEYGQVLMGK